MTDSSAVPLAVAVQFAHAAAQAVADQRGLDVLHIKGPALDGSISPRALDGSSVRDSSDADVWVRPSQVARYVAALTESGWKQVVRFEDGSAFEHASTFWHDYLGYLDLHRRFPGITIVPEKAFDVLWAERQVAEIAGYPCQVPSLAAQRLVVLLHVARGGDRAGDVQYAWTELDDHAQAEVRALAHRLGADVALAVCVGGPEADSPEAALWRARTAPGTPLVTVWAARVRAEHGLWRKARVAVRQLVPNRRRLEFLLGREVTTGDLVRATGSRLRSGVREIGRLIKARRDHA